MKYLICNDTHVAVQRTGGTTPATAAAIRQRVLDNFEGLLFAHKDLPIIHAGDIFDTFDVPNRDLVALYEVLAKWLMVSGQKFVALRANHDWNPRGDKLSSWELLMTILQAQFGSRVVPVTDTLTHIEGNLYGLGHTSNQDCLNLELAKALELTDSVLIAHANYNNFFAQNSDHSLNIDEAWAKEFVAKGNRLYCGHEHQRSEHLGGKVVMLGSQDATSIADCLGNDTKFAHILEDDGSLTKVPTMDVSAEYAQCDWKEIQDAPAVPFLRISGHAAASEAADVITAIAKLRSKSQSLIITNAVAVEGCSNMGALTETSLEAIQSFNVLGALLELLEPAERATIEEILK